MTARHARSIVFGGQVLTKLANNLLKNLVSSLVSNTFTYFKSDGLAKAVSEINW
jgi:hypothetical protein